MNKEYIFIEDSKIFELRFKDNDKFKKVTECIESVAFSKNTNEIYITIQEYLEKTKITYIVEALNQELVKDGFYIMILDRQGNITSQYEFNDCTFNDIAEIKLHYNPHIVPVYIIRISYNKVYKIEK